MFPVTLHTCNISRWVMVMLYPRNWWISGEIKEGKTTMTLCYFRREIGFFSLFQVCMMILFILFGDFLWPCVYWMAGCVMDGALHCCFFINWLRSLHACIKMLMCLCKNNQNRTHGWVIIGVSECVVEEKRRRRRILFIRGILKSSVFLWCDI